MCLGIQEIGVEAKGICGTLIIFNTTDILYSRDVRKLFRAFYFYLFIFYLSIVDMQYCIILVSGVRYSDSMFLYNVITPLIHCTNLSQYY